MLGVILVVNQNCFSDPDDIPRLKCGRFDLPVIDVGTTCAAQIKEKVMPVLGSQLKVVA